MCYKICCTGLLPIILAFGIGMLLLSSCSSPRYAYTANAGQLPFFNEQGQAEASASWATQAWPAATNGSSRVNGLEGSAAFAAGKWWAVQTGFRSRSERDVFDSLQYRRNPFASSEVRYRRGEWESGLGVFFPVNDARSIVLNLWGGVGLGRYRIEESGLIGALPYDRQIEHGITRWHLMPALTLMPSPWLRIGYFGRFSHLQYREKSSTYSQAEQELLGLAGLQNRSVGMTEWGYHLQLGSRATGPFRLTHQLVVAAPPENIRVRGVHISLGIAWVHGAREWRMGPRHGPAY